MSLVRKASALKEASELAHYLSSSIVIFPIHLSEPQDLLLNPNPLRNPSKRSDCSSRQSFFMLLCLSDQKKAIPALRVLVFQVLEDRKATRKHPKMVGHGRAIGKSDPHNMKNKPNGLQQYIPSRFQKTFLQNQTSYS